MHLQAQPPSDVDPSSVLIEQAISKDPAVADQARGQLRQMGYGGLDLLLIRCAGELTKPGADVTEIRAAINAVGGQYDDDVSKLYWYTDLEAAKAAAAAQNKPILCLELLGRLDQNLSCANSRLFRATLYPDPKVNALLRNNFILCWQSVRPAPVITIDFGDGRKLVRTITGNSIHYVLSPTGEIVDALPGLYTADTFSDALTKAQTVALQPSADHFKSYQIQTEKRLMNEWQNELAAVLPKNDARLKSLVPVKISDAPDSTDYSALKALEAATDDSVWGTIATKQASASGPQQFALLAQSTTHDPVQTVMERKVAKFPTAMEASRMTISKSIAESPLLRMMRELKSHVQLDSVRDYFWLRSEVLQVLIEQHAYSPSGTLSLGRVNDMVYANIFLTPKDDPYLGLQTNGVAAVDDDGECVTSTATH